MAVPIPQDLFDFAGKVVIVTGSGSGLGSGIAARFVQAGASVVVNYLKSEENALTMVSDMNAQGGKAIAVQADVTKRADAQRLVAETVKAFGQVDVLINNAGVYPLHSLLEMSEEDWDLVVDANLKSAFLCTQAVAKQMIAQGDGGAIINISSIEGVNPAPMHSHYNAAKGGVLMHTKASAYELGEHGIRVNCVSPGLIWRKGLDEAWPDGVERYKRAVPLKRLGLPDDVADACLFLASAGARWITGANLFVDGGVLTKQIF
jgi:NAD(P)-dependent dehydrogenase (short-subunit alcohol dehydrogenase family)